MLVPLFQPLLDGKRLSLLVGDGRLPGRGMAFDELELLTADRDEPRLAAPEVVQIFEQAAWASCPVVVEALGA